MSSDPTQQGVEEDPEALDKIVSDQSQQRIEDRQQRGSLVPADDADIPRPSEDGDADADMDEPVAGRHQVY